MVMIKKFLNGISNNTIGIIMAYNAVSFFIKTPEPDWQIKNRLPFQK